MQLVEQHIINKNQAFFKEIDELSFASKNLYHYVNFWVSQYFIKMGNYIKVVFNTGAFGQKSEGNLMSYIGNKGISNRIQTLTTKRNHKIKDYLHKASRKIIDLAEKHHVKEIIIGYNKSWKQEINIKIKITLIEESYTSKVDHLANESLKKQKVYLGKRIKRGLFKSSTGKIINADLNDSLGICRKVVSNAIGIFAKEIEGIVVFPEQVTV